MKPRYAACCGRSEREPGTGCVGWGGGNDRARRARACTRCLCRRHAAAAAAMSAGEPCLPASAHHPRLSEHGVSAGAVRERARVRASHGLHHSRHLLPRRCRRPAAVADGRNVRHEKMREALRLQQRRGHRHLAPQRVAEHRTPPAVVGHHPQKVPRHGLDRCVVAVPGATVVTKVQRHDAPVSVQLRAPAKRVRCVLEQYAPEHAGQLRASELTSLFVAMVRKFALDPSSPCMMSKGGLRAPDASKHQ